MPTLANGFFLTLEEILQPKTPPQVSALKTVYFYNQILNNISGYLYLKAKRTGPGAGIEKHCSDVHSFGFSISKPIDELYSAPCGITVLDKSVAGHIHKKTRQKIHTSAAIKYLWATVVNNNLQN